MKRQKMIQMITMIAMILMLTACGTDKKPVNKAEDTTQEPDSQVAEIQEEDGQATEEVTDEEDGQTAETEEAATEQESAESSFADLITLLDMNDTDTADLFGGGAENWTEDKSFYIGRTYQITLYDEDVVMHTTCDKEKKVTSVALWIKDGSQPLAEEDVNKWIERVTAFTESEPTYNDTTSEGGSEGWTWRHEKNAFSLFKMGDILSLYIQPMVCEIK